MKLLILSFLFSLFVNDGSNVALAFPNAAGGCDSGVAVGQTHLVNPTTGSLSTGGFQIFLDDTTPLQPNTPTSITANQLYSLSIVPSAGATFRGALFRIEGFEATLAPGTNAQVAQVCTQVPGVCHLDKDDKTEFDANFQVSGTADVTLEVTIVVANTVSTGGSSVYYYDLFTLQPSDAVSTPMAAPTAAPAAAPTMVEVPVPAPTVAPASAPIEIPVAVAVPTYTPEVTPTVTPVAVMEPTGTPALESPSIAPVMEPTQMMESDAPSTDMNMTEPEGNSTGVDVPMSAPVRAPTMIVTPTPNGTSTSAVLTSFPRRGLFSTLVAVVIVAVI